MTDYRYLTDNEIAALEGNGCKAENWDDVETAEGFVAGNYRNVFLLQKTLTKFLTCHSR